MKHNFTRDQIEQAVIEAAKKRAGFCVDQMLDSAPHNVTLGEVGDLRAFLSALPELDPSYPEIALDDVRKGDRVRITTTQGYHYEVTAENVGQRLLWWGGQSIHKNDIERVHLIERPVKNPDPVEHPVIYVKDCDLVNFIPEIMVWYRDSYVAGRQCLSPERITDWQPIDPAKVVADDD